MTPLKRVSLYILLLEPTSSWRPTAWWFETYGTPIGGMFDASGDIAALLSPGASPLLDAVDAYGVTKLASSEMTALATELDALPASIPDRTEVEDGRGWHGEVLPGSADGRPLRV